MSDAAIDRTSRAIGQGLEKIADSLADNLGQGDPSEAIRRLAQALDDNLTSPNVPDDNIEPANIVDVVNRLARAIDALADAITALAETQQGDTNADATPTG